MIQILNNKVDEIKTACKKYRVKSLYVFGSAVTGKFNNESDIDFLLDYFKTEEGLPVEGFDYFDLMFLLEEITGKKVDLVVDGAVKNPFFKQRIESEKILLYAA